VAVWAEAESGWLVGLAEVKRVCQPELELAHAGRWRGAAGVFMEPTVQQSQWRAESCLRAA
jgi:hypothetical protein